MRTIDEESFHYSVFEDETDGAIYLSAVCNQSAAYFTVETRLLPAEIGMLFAPGTRTLTARGKKLVSDLADAAQWSPRRFHDARDKAWREVGHPGQPPIPRLY